MKVLTAVLVVLAALVGAIALFAWSGIYNVAATEPHWKATEEFLEMVRTRSIQHHSRGSTLPPLEGQHSVETGFVHYHAMCQRCHGAPGRERQEFALGLYPGPPGLANEHIQEEWSDAEIFWIVQHGLKMTGMPAFGPTHSAGDLGAIVAFLKELPSLQPEAYEAMVQRAGMDGTGNGHDHGHENTHDGTSPQ